MANCFGIQLYHPFHSYALPPPSRSRENTINIFDPDYKAPQYTQSNPQVTQHYNSNNNNNNNNNNDNQFNYSLVPIYIPNQGYRYFVVVPVEKWNYMNTNFINADEAVAAAVEQSKYDKYDKLNGRYNAKLKKYKAYEKFLKPAIQQQVSQACLVSEPSFQSSPSIDVLKVAQH